MTTTNFLAPSPKLKANQAEHHNPNPIQPTPLKAFLLSHLIMLFTTAAARLSRATARRCFTSTSAVNGVPTVHYDHFASGWNVENDEPFTEGKFHIETFNKISPLVCVVYVNT